jgi:hypothetical protein
MVYQGFTAGKLFYNHNPQKPHGFHSSEMQLVISGIERTSVNSWFNFNS